MPGHRHQTGGQDELDYILFFSFDATRTGFAVFSVAAWLDL